MNIFRSLDNFEKIQKHHRLYFTFKVKQDHDSARQYLQCFYRKIMNKNLMHI